MVFWLSLLVSTVSSRLHDLLIGPEGRHGAEKAVQSRQHKEIGVREQALQEGPAVRLPTDAGPQSKIFSLPALPAIATTAAAPPSMRREQKNDGHHPGHREGQGLHHIGPNHRLDPAPGDIENADDRKQQDGGNDRPAD